MVALHSFPLPTLLHDYYFKNNSLKCWERIIIYYKLKTKQHEEKRKKREGAISKFRSI